MRFESEKMVKKTKLARVGLGLMAMVLMGLSAPSSAISPATVYWSAGANCSGTNSATYTAGGSSVTMSLCVDTVGVGVCGASIQPQTASAGESGAFNIINRVLGAALPDASAGPSYPIPISNPPDTTDFGGSLAIASPNAPAGASGQLLATFTIAPQAGATNASYVIGASALSVVSTLTSGSNCFLGTPSDTALPTFTLIRNVAPLITSANTTTFTVGTPGTFTVTATGTPTPTLSKTSGTLPNGVTFTAGTGALAGTPTQAGTFTPIMFKAANTILPDATQSFTLVVNKGDQAITFTNPGTKTFSTTPFALSATGGGSNLPVTFTSATTPVCTVSGSNVTMKTAGTCTINADQAGDANYNAAPQNPQSFTINATVPGAPTGVSAAPADTAAVVQFTAPANNGGSTILDYTATCTSVSPPDSKFITGATAPITVTSLTNGVAYTCVVTARNSAGSGAASSPPAPVTPASVPAITSANTTTFTVGTPGTFTVTVTGAPVPTLSQTGTLPNGVTFTAGTGVLAGTPTQAGTFPLVFTAANGTLPNAVQPFSLVVNKADQTISFTGPGNQNFSPVPIPLSATATSLLTVAFTSHTPLVCSVLGTSVTMITAGTCTINANQPGNANYNAAPQVQQSFDITATLPGAPVITSIVPGDRSATVFFTLPNTGGSPIQGFVVNCSPGAVSVPGATSPIVLSNLVNNVPYTCTVTATNGVGAGDPSTAAQVTPAVPPTSVPTLSQWVLMLLAALMMLAAGRELALRRKG